MPETTYRPDILITGGGVAGIGAVLGAARQGLDVMLLERNTYLGGAATAAYVSTVCGLFYRAENGQPEYVMEGAVRSFAEKLARASESTPVSFAKGLFFLPYARHAFMRLADEAVRGHTQVFLEAVVHDVDIDDHKVQRVHATVSNHRLRIEPKAVVDCSGDALIGRLGGHTLRKDEEYQAGAQVFSMTGLRGDDDRNISLQLIKAIRQGIESGNLPSGCERLSLVPGSFKAGNANFKLGIPEQITDALANHTNLQINARQLVQTAVDFLKVNTIAFANAEISMIAPGIGIRTGLRYHGVETLTDADVLSCKKSTESVARGAWPIEIWRVGSSVDMQYFAERDYYDIPAGCLESPEFDNLWFAGRHMSATEGAVGSARVIGTAMASGIGAGILAAGKIRGVARGDCIAGIQAQMTTEVTGA